MSKQTPRKPIFEVMLLSHLAILTAWLSLLEGRTAVARLPRWLVPLRYRVDILTRINQPYQPFGGVVAIDFRSEKATKVLALNARGLEIGMGKSVTVGPKGEEAAKVNRLEMNDKLSRVTVHLKSALKVNVTYVLKMTFTSVLRHDNTGFYSNTYMDDNTTLAQWFAATQFEPHYARDAFPCFDDPIFRTPFAINLAHPNQYRALSNMPVKRTIRHARLSDFVWTQFQESPPMQTYLVAFAIVKFEKAGFVSRERPNCTISTWARPDALRQTEFANLVVAPLLAFYEKLFDIAFRQPKIDQLALPNFAFSARECQGMPTFGEEAIMYDSERSSMGDQQGVARSVAKTVVHQWFGNLVSIVWWDELWLKNAFALYLSRFGVEALRPEWDYQERHALRLYLTVLEHDAHVNTDLVASPVADESQIWAAYSENAESKATVLFEMLHRILGEEAWLKGLRRFLVLHANSSATSADFWEVLQLHVDRDGRLGKGLNISRTMESWLHQPGYPLLTVTRDYHFRSALVDQRRFFISPLARQRSESNPCWWVPLSFTCPECPDVPPSRWLTCSFLQGRRPKTVVLEKLPAGVNDWLLFNVRHSAPFRVNYDLRNWQLLNATLSDPKKFKTIHRVNRAQLVDDVFNLAWSGIMDYPMALGILSYLSHEDEFVVWEATQPNFERINNVAKRNHNYRVYKTYMRMLVERQFTQLLSSGNMTHRRVILRLACEYELPACVSLARREFAKGSAMKASWMTVRERETVFCTAVKFGTEDDRDELEKMYQRSNSAAEQEWLLTALACSRNPFGLERVLRWTFEDDGIRKHNAKRTFKALVYNPVGYSLAKQYVSENMQHIRDYCSNSTSQVVRLLRPLLEGLSTQKELEFFRTFFKEFLGDMTGIDRLIKVLLERGNDNVHWQRTKYRPMLNAIQDIIFWRKEQDLKTQ
ncbi:aminopeptidase N isoform X2 [Drosophila ficusphila]|uniref:aminopeptidase N isoform X2 n=1 Tax=Drosophila ficusphila TaxID=30025 RepID=UPI0007E8139C|nr:aminopeptidase N isoform X2 [Drosophila ficusphila]